MAKPATASPNQISIYCHTKQLTG